MQTQPLESIAPEILDQLRRVSTATACAVLIDLGIRRTFMHGIRPLFPLGPDGRIVGRAITVRYLPLREDVVESISESERLAQPYRQAIESLEPNDVLVVDAMGSLEGGVIGDILAARIKYRGGVAAVIDGAVRDSPFVRQVGLPIFVKGLHPAPSTLGLISTDMNIPIQCGGVLVLPGDVILGDDDGVLVVPRKLAAKVAEIGWERENLEIFIRSKVEQGASISEVYPPNEALRREYEQYRGKRS